MRIPVPPIKIEFSEKIGYHVHFMIDYPEHAKSPEIWFYDNWEHIGKFEVKPLNDPFWHYYCMKLDTAIDYKEYTNNFIWI